MSRSLGNWIDGKWIPASGTEFVSTNPATDEILWQGTTSSADDVNAAIVAARAAAGNWASTPVEERKHVIQAFSTQLEANHEELSLAICREVGKPLWEARTEVQAMIGKVELSIRAMQERRSDVSFAIKETHASTRYKPHGVLTVFGPFNFPGHISNGHIVPAILAGNCVVFKPSELTPAVAELTCQYWQAAGLPDGVLNLLQGARETGVALVNHPGHQGVLFTGSLKAGLAISRALVDRPNTILALELGGNNPLVVVRPNDLAAAVYATIQSAFLTSGQRCTCARRLIVVDGNNDYLERLTEAISGLTVGMPEGNPQPFMGTLINSAAVDRVLDEQQQLVKQGATAVVSATKLDPGNAFISPGLIDVTGLELVDEEVFGPLIQLIRVPDFASAIEVAKKTQYGLVAGLFSQKRSQFEQFFREVNAGLIHWNCPTTGASGKLPFGGVGLSGNHRPAGYFMIDSCNVPIASLERPELSLPETLLPGVSLP